MDEWLARFEVDLLPRLLADQRFVDAARMIKLFQECVGRWRDSGEVRPLINSANELCAADAILRRMSAEDRLRYEKRLLATPKSIDFCVEQPGNVRGWIDMKTVAPGWQDDESAWERINKIRADMPGNTHVVLDRDLGGAGLGGQLIKTRWTFVQRAIELEAKIALLKDVEHGPVRLLLCSEGAWHADDLEDFADFYRTGSFRDDDWAQNAIQHYMSERSLSFNHSIAGFCYLERRQEAVAARTFTLDVRGPAMFSPQTPTHA
jgi:hypothetical protein